MERVSGKGAPSGSFKTTCLREVRYGPDSIEQLSKVMQEIVPEGQTPRVLLMTGRSLSKTPVIPHVEDLLKRQGAYAATFTGMRQHAPAKDIEQALELLRHHQVNLVVGVGGGSVIDACKLLSYHHKQQHGSYVNHIAVPTTLSAAEFTSVAGYTNEDGDKATASDENICPKSIILDPKLTRYTPEKLWLSTGIRALDHAFEGLYRPGAQYPLQQMALAAIRDLFTYLPQCMDNNQDDLEARGRLQVAAWMSLYPTKLETGLGPSHALGHALGATYSIPHGYCSVLTLPNTIRIMARTLPAGEARGMLANVFSYLPTSFVRDHMSLHDDREDGDTELSTCLVGAAALDKLIEKLGLTTSLSHYEVPKEDLAKIAAKAQKATVAKPGWDSICPSAKELQTKVLEAVY